MNKLHLKLATAFGKDLIKTQDLDPVYTAMVATRGNSQSRALMFFAYTCLYHLGASTKIAGWDTLQTAATNEGLRWPRGSERRHWRGANAQATIDYGRSKYATPEEVVKYWATGSLKFSAVSARVRELPAYGPWIAFKVADMLERVMFMPVDFSDCALGVYDEPRKAAALLLTGDAEEKITDAQLTQVIEKLRTTLGDLKAPPTFNRIINVQEIETLLCKYKSHVNGHYPHGKDTREVLHGLRDPRWDGPVTRKMIKALEALPYAN